MHAFTASIMFGKLHTGNLQVSFCQQSSRYQIAMLCNASISSVGVHLTDSIQRVLCVFSKHIVQSPAHDMQKKYIYHGHVLRNYFYD